LGWRLADSAILDSLFLATTTVGYQGHVKYAVPGDFVVRACRQAGVA
jgi:D-aminopeptidase